MSIIRTKGRGFGISRTFRPGNDPGIVYPSPSMLSRLSPVGFEPTTFPGWGRSNQLSYRAGQHNNLVPHFRFELNLPAYETRVYSE